MSDIPINDSPEEDQGLFQILEAWTVSRAPGWQGPRIQVNAVRQQMG